MAESLAAQPPYKACPLKLQGPCGGTPGAWTTLQLLWASSARAAAHPPGPWVPGEGQDSRPALAAGYEELWKAPHAGPALTTFMRPQEASLFENTCLLAKHCDHCHVDPPAGSPTVPKCGGWQGPCWRGCCFLSVPAAPEQGCDETLPTGGDGPLAQSWGLTGPRLPPRRTLVSQPKAVFRGNCADGGSPGVVPGWGPAT